jgi:membrane associated rhomboid family serine protease
VTECPYCGQRVRKRAPKIERGSAEDAPGRRRRRPRAPTLGRLRRGEIPGIAPEVRPYATGVIVLLALAATVAIATGQVGTFRLGAIYGPVDGEWWRVAAAPFVYSTNDWGYEFVALMGVAVFGTLLERRFGPVAVVAIAIGAAAAGAALAVVLKSFPVLGGNGMALGLLTAWVVDDRLALRRGDDRGNDMIGVWVFAAVLLLLPVAAEDANFYAGIGGAAAGAVAGAAISPLRP